ncbi:hypothetical protein SAMN05444487_101228 [Marininema mesophilum]|uniref:Bacteriocin-associated integral membrane (Putative immunity) protein n=1 Tax=Marininema mesophilum TaxID=1048340 RepID=A0A1H2QHU6_9BACL|nr:DUF1430 domain-containing protein [Marininema mesophilum]SDW06763.1 hypothetical protein SAMN05444487_101228 [Marininema mesophilum]
MKKIIFMLILVSYSLSSFILTNYYEAKEVHELQSGNKERINVVGWDKKEKVEEKLNKITKISRDEKTNIYKVIYKPVKTAEMPKIVLYVALGDKKKFQQQFQLKWGNFFRENEPKQNFLSSHNEKDNQQIGRIKLFSPTTMAEVRLLEAAKYENIRGTYLIDSQNKKILTDIKQRMKTEVGLDVKKETTLSVMDIFNDEGINSYLFVILIIVMVLICLCFLYYILLSFKELAILKMFGSSDAGLIVKHLMKMSIIIHLMALGTVLLGQALILVFYNGMSKIVDFSTEWMTWQLIFTCASVLISFIPFLMVYHIDIAAMLKNKKPIGLIQFLNYSSKLILTSLILFLFANLFHDYQEFRVQTSNQEKWETAKRYAFYEYQADNPENLDQWEYETGLKSKKLFKQADQKGAILVSPADGIVYKQKVKGFPPYDPDSGNVIYVNNNFLKENPVYDTKGNLVTVPEEDDRRIVVLVPKRLAGDSQLKDTYKKWYQFKRYIDEDMRNKRIGKKKRHHPKVNVTIIPIKDQQKHFLYNPEINKANQNYGVDSVLVVVNGNNMGGDSYLNYLTSGTFFAKTSQMDKPYEGLKQDIASAGLKDIILTTPSLYSKVDSYLFELKNKMKINSLLFFVLLTVGVVITVFMTLNYLERNKMIHAVKKVNGYSFYRRHYHFIGTVALLWMIIAGGAIAFKSSIVTSIILLLSVCLVLEVIIIYVVIKIGESKRTKDTLKGA